MRTGLEAAFWCACTLVAYTYLGYPLLLFLASSAAELRRAWRRLRDGMPAASPAPDASWPAVSIIVAAHNEEAELPHLLSCLRHLDYPRERLELVLVSDGSDDGSEAYLAAQPDAWIRCVRQPRQGKAAALNTGVAAAHHTLLVLMDASTRPQPGTLRQLVRHFADPQVGVVCGALRFVHPGNSQSTEGAYWSFECLLRLMEGRLGATLTASGALYAVRKACFPPLRATAWIEDFLVPMHARQTGLRVLYDPEAWAWETAAASVGGEFRRRQRLAIGSFRALPALWRTRLNWVTRWALVSHKLLRWSVPFLLLAALASNLALWPVAPYRLLLLLQLAGYGLACAAASGLRLTCHWRLAQGLYFFLAMNAAFLCGFVRFVFDREETAWQQVR
ncbi:MAG: glycosyltransferase [Terriglobales bacterium]